MTLDLSQYDEHTPRFTFKGREATAKCVSVYDGDTASFVFQPCKGSPAFKYSCRMYGYNSAEMHGRTKEEKTVAKQARDELASIICGKLVTLKFHDEDKYGRPLVDVYIDEVHVNKLMLDLGYGKEYYGKGEKLW